MKLLLPLILILVITACADKPQLTEPRLLVNTVDTVVAPIVNEERTLDAKEALRAIYDTPLDEYSVVYTLTQTASGQKKQSSESLYVKGEKERTDMEIDVDGQRYKERNIGLGDSIIVCASQGTWECYKLSLPPNATRKPSFDELWGKNDVRFSPDRLVVGTVTNCFISAVTVPEEGVFTSEACYTDDGIPLYFEMKGPQGTLVQQATSYDVSVSDSVFTPPVTPGTEEEFIVMMNATQE